MGVFPVCVLWKTVKETGIISERFGGNQRKAPETEGCFVKKAFAFLVFQLIFTYCKVPRS